MSDGVTTFTAIQWSANGTINEATTNSKCLSERADALDGLLNGKTSAKRTASDKHQSLDLRDMNLQECPTTVLQLEHLRVLLLDHNYITAIPKGISALVQLSTLSLSYNAIRRLDRALGQLPELRTLALDSNRLQEWPDWLCVGLSRLRLLRLQGNPHIPGIPLTFAQMTQLEQCGFDWYGYLLPQMDSLLSGESGRRHIEATRTLCQQLAKTHSVATAPTSAKKRCSKAPNVLAKTGVAIHNGVAYCTFLKFFSVIVLQGQGNVGSTLRFYSKNRSPLHIACKFNHESVVAELISANFNINSLDVDGCTGLMVALRFGAAECAKLLLLEPRMNASLPSMNYSHPLHVAIATGQFEVAQLIARHPLADLGAKDAQGSTALHLLFRAFESNPQLARSLAEVLVANPNCPLNESNALGLTALHCAARARQHLAIRFAVEHNLKHSHSATTAGLQLLSYLALVFEARFLDLSR